MRNNASFPYCLHSLIPRLSALLDSALLLIITGINIYIIYASSQYPVTVDPEHPEKFLQTPLKGVACSIGSTGCGKSTLLNELLSSKVTI